MRKLFPIIITVIITVTILLETDVLYCNYIENYYTGGEYKSLAVCNIRWKSMHKRPTYTNKSQ